MVHLCTCMKSNVWCRTSFAHTHQLSLLTPIFTRYEYYDFLTKSFYLKSSKRLFHEPQHGFFSSQTASAQAKFCQNVLVFPLFEFNGDVMERDPLTPRGSLYRGLHWSLPWCGGPEIGIPAWPLKDPIVDVDVIIPGLSSAAGGQELPAERWRIPESAH